MIVLKIEKLFLCQNDRNTISLDQPEPREAKLLRFRKQLEKPRGGWLGYCQVQNLHRAHFQFILFMT